MRKYLLLLSFIILAPYMCAKARAKVVKVQEGYSPEAMVANAEATYDYNAPAGFEHFRDSDYVFAEKAVYKCINPSYEEYDRNTVDEMLYENLLDATQVKYGEEQVIRAAAIYLMSGMKIYDNVAYQALATAYANLQDRDNLRYVLHCFEHSDINADGDYDGLIAQMREQMDAILNPTNFASSVQGTWVADYMPEYSSKLLMEFPYHVMEIRALTDDGIFSENLPGGGMPFRMGGSALYKTFYMAQSMSFDNPTEETPGHLSAMFCSQHLQRGINTSEGFEITRKFQADMAGKIASSNASFGAQIGATIGTTVIAGLMNMAMIAAAQSTHTIITMTVNLDQVQPDVLQGHLSALSHTVSTSNPNAEPGPPFEKDLNYLRWLPEDSVYFVTNEGKIYSVTAPENLELSEYNRVTERWKKIRTGVTIATVVGGAGMIAGGVALCATSSSKKKSSTGKIVGGCLLSSLGVATAIAVPTCLFTISPSRLYKDVNKHQMQKLRDKRNPPQVTIQPTVNPWEGSGGFLMNIQY